MDRTYYDDVTSVLLSYDATQEMISKLFSRESELFHIKYNFQKMYI